MPTLPALNPKTKENKSPHIFILGSGASKACFPNGDKNGKKFPLMDESFIEIVGLKEIIKSRKINIKGINFEDFYNDLAISKRDSELQSLIEKEVYDYFSSMIIPSEPTLYDYLILSLRSKDLIATFNWDPMLIQAYRRNINLQKLPRLCFLHGNVGIGVCIKDRQCGYLDQKCIQCGELYQKVKLLYPVKKKNYSADPFINNEWEILKAYLKDAYILTIFGYGAPKTDIEAIDIMKEIWRKNSTKELAQIEIIDIKGRDEIYENWKEFIVRQHYGVINSLRKSYLLNHPRRSYDAFAGANLQGKPWENNPFPDLRTLSELHIWIKPLIEEEIAVETNGIAFRIE